MQKILIYKMGKTRGVHETTPELRNRMVGMFEAGLGLRDIAAAVNCSQRTVKRWLNRFEREGTVETRERCGRKRATTSEQDEAIIKLATQTPITAAKTVLPALGLSCSVDTVRERLHKAGIHSWSPSRKHIQRMDAGGVSIHQAVWRPTGTHLGKKKSQKSSDKSTKKKPNKPIIPSTKKKKKSSSPKKKPPENETDSIDQIGNNTLPSESIKEPVLQSGLSYSPIQYNVPVNEVPSRAITINNNPQNSHHQIQYSNALELAESSMPIYHQQLNESQNWPLDLVQSNHHHHHNHYPQNPQTSVSPEPHLHELYPAPRNHNLEQSQHNNNLHENQQLHHPHHHDHHQLSDQQHHKQVSQLMNNSVSTLDGGDKIIDNNSDNCSNSNLSIDNRDSSKEDDEDEDDDEFISDDGKDDKSKKKNSKIDGNNRKKGGKAKGTLETSVEIRNRMIGMSEAGLSTLSIALAINRSERTVKRWLERWNKEGNVQTKERKGRRRITTKEQDDAIIQMATDNPLTAAKLVAPALGLNCSVDTIRERLHKAGIHSWKLGKKQGEGNAIHTVHLWQPSGNRVNKPKQITDKKKKSLVKKKREKTNEIISTSTKKYSPKKKNLETTKIQSLSTVQGPSSLPAPVNIIPEQNSMQFNHPEAVSSYVPEQNLMPRVGIPVINSLVTSTVTPPPPSIVPLDSMMQQQPRPDCRMTTSGPPSNLMPSQSTSSLAYSSCMIANNNHHPNHIDHHHHQQPDPLNYEPYMWNFPMEFSNV